MKKTKKSALLVIVLVLMISMMSSLLVNIHAQTFDGVIMPSALKAGDQVCVIAPATAVSQTETKAAVDYLNAKGYKAVSVSGLSFGEGTDQQRADVFNSIVADKKNKAIICLRGGYGSMTFMDKINYEKIRENRPIFVGYSDLTAIMDAIYKYSGLVTFHGPMLRSNAGQEESFNQLFDILSSPKSNWEMKNLNGESFESLGQGVCEGKIVGGNLSVICSTIGTPYDVDMKGKILFIEEVDETPQSIHGFLNQLKLSGKLNELKGIVIGDLTNCDVGSKKAIDTILDFFGNYNIPIVYGLHAGHGDEPMTIPIGASVKINSQTVTVLGSAIQ